MSNSLSRQQMVISALVLHNRASRMRRILSRNRNVTALEIQ